MLPQSVGVLVESTGINSGYAGNNLGFVSASVDTQVSLVILTKEMSGPGVALLAPKQRPYRVVNDLTSISLYNYHMTQR
jgi:hypothetical protein